MYVEEISLNMYLKIINKDGGKTNENNEKGTGCAG